MSLSNAVTDGGIGAGGATDWSAPVVAPIDGHDAGEIE
jgi:hypothetical protein